MAAAGVRNTGTHHHDLASRAQGALRNPIADGQLVSSALRNRIATPNDAARLDPVAAVAH